MSKRTLEEKCLAKYETAWRTALTMADNDKTVAVGIFQAITKAETLDKIAHTIEHDVGEELHHIRSYVEEFVLTYNEENKKSRRE